MSTLNTAPAPPATPGRAGETTDPLRVTLDERLVEAAVLAAAPGRPFEERYAFHREREAIYEVRDPDAREAAFRQVFLRWFERWRLDRPIRRALAEQPLLGARASGCRVMLALGFQDEGANVYGPAPGSDAALPEIGIRIRASMLVDAETCLAFLRHELQHVADMLDPAFGYERDLPPLDGGPPYEALVRRRYHVVWDATIDGRLVRQGRAAPSSRQRRRDEFARTFAAIGSTVDEEFARWFDHPQPTHQAILAFVLARGTPLDRRHLDALTTVVCPLCRFPTTPQAYLVGDIPPAVQAEVRRRHPAWSPAQGLCRQCCDLIEARLGTAS